MKSVIVFVMTVLSVSVMAQSFELNGNELVLPSPIVFLTGSDSLSTESEPALQHIKKYLDAKSYVTLIRVEGHVSTSGSSGQKLSEKRSLAVARWLLRNSIDCSRILPVGFGDTKPIANSDTEGRASNSRITIINVTLRGRAIGGAPTDGGGRVAGNPCQWAQ
jgi:OmpA-OmpF porin, OOP family